MDIYTMTSSQISEYLMEQVTRWKGMNEKDEGPNEGYAAARIEEYKMAVILIGDLPEVIEEIYPTA